jgi:hypothetical protein
MPPIPHLLFLSFSLAGLSLLTLSAQEAEITSVEFSTLAIGAPPAEPLFLIGEDNRPLQIQPHHARRSQTVRYRGPNPLVFKRLLVQENGERVYEPVAQWQANPALNQPLLLFFPEGSGFRVGAIEDSFTQYPLGSYRFYNLTQRRLVGRLGETSVDLPPRQTVHLERPFPSDQAFPIAFVVEEMGAYEPIYSARWSHFNAFRYLIFVSAQPGSDTGPLSFRIVSDFPRSTGNR